MPALFCVLLLFMLHAGKESNCLSRSRSRCSLSRCSPRLCSSGLHKKMFYAFRVKFCFGFLIDNRSRNIWAWMAMRQLEAKNGEFCGLAQDGSSQDHEPFEFSQTILASRDLRCLQLHMREVPSHKSAFVTIPPAANAPNCQRFLSLERERDNDRKGSSKPFLMSKGKAISAWTRS